MSGTAIITAASKGLGKAIAEKLHEDGFKLLLMARGEEVHQLAESLNGVGLIGDVGNPEDLKRLVDAAAKTGSIDVVVNNTGHVAKGLLTEISDQDWTFGFNLLLMNVIRMSRLVTPIMKNQGSGSIINISTFAAFEPDARFPVSSVIRAGLGSYTSLFASEMAEDGIRMNNVLPGFMDSFPEKPEVLEEIPMGRYASVNEVANLVSFLAGEGSAYITGQNLRIDGGITKHV